MKARRNDRGRLGAAKGNAPRGFTMIELLVASTISVIVGAAIFAVFLWAMNSAYESEQYGWAQTESIKSSQKIVSLVRNALAIHDIDASGNWIELSMPPTGRVYRLEYVNTTGQAGDGRMLFMTGAGGGATTNVIGSGLTKVMTLPVRNIFEQTSSNSVRIAYRITKPGGRSDYPSEVDVGAFLRNYEE